MLSSITIGWKAAVVTEQSDPAPPQTTRQRLIAIALVCAAVVCFTVIDVGAKWLTPRHGVLQTTFLRYTSGLFWVLIYINPWRVPDLLQSRMPRLQALRGTLLLASTGLNFIAIQYLQLAQTVSIMFMAPLLVSLLAGPILGEWAGPRRLVAIAVGFIGVLIITRPGTGAIHPAALFSVLAMFCYAAILLMTRKLSASDSPETTMFYSSLLGLVVLLPLVFSFWATPDTLLDWAAIAAIGLGGAMGHWMLILAQRSTNAPVLAPFLYTQIIWMALAGYLFFGEMPDLWTFVGSGVVISSGLYLLHRERVRAMEARQRAAMAPHQPSELDRRG